MGIGRNLVELHPGYAQEGVKTLHSTSRSYLDISSQRATASVNGGIHVAAIVIRVTALVM